MDGQKATSGLRSMKTGSTVTGVRRVKPEVKTSGRILPVSEAQEPTKPRSSRAVDSSLSSEIILSQVEEPEAPAVSKKSSGVRRIREQGLNPELILKQTDRPESDSPAKKSPSASKSGTKRLREQGLSSDVILPQVSATKVNDDPSKKKVVGLKRLLTQPRTGGVVPGLSDAGVSQKGIEGKKTGVRRVVKETTDSGSTSPSKRPSVLSTSVSASPSKQSASKMSVKKSSSPSKLATLPKKNSGIIHIHDEARASETISNAIFSAKETAPEPKGRNKRIAKEGRVNDGRVFPSTDAPIPDNGSQRFSNENLVGNATSDSASRISQQSGGQTPKSKRFFWSERKDSANSTPLASPSPKRMLKTAQAGVKSAQAGGKALFTSVQQGGKSLVASAKEGIKRNTAKDGKTTATKQDTQHNVAQQEDSTTMKPVEQQSLHQELVQTRLIQENVDQTEEHREQYEVHDMDAEVVLENVQPELPEEQREEQESPLEQSHDLQAVGNVEGATGVVAQEDREYVDVVSGYESARDTQGEQEEITEPQESAAEEHNEGHEDVTVQETQEDTPVLDSTQEDQEEVAQQQDISVEDQGGQEEVSQGNIIIHGNLEDALELINLSGRDTQEQDTPLQDHSATHEQDTQLQEHSADEHVISHDVTDSHEEVSEHISTGLPLEQPKVMPQEMGDRQGQEVSEMPEHTMDVLG